MATTLAQVRTNVTARLGLDNSTTGDQPQIDFYANEAVREILKETSCTAASASVTPGAVADYTWSTAQLGIIGITISSGGSTYIPQRRSVEEILDFRRNTAAAAPTRFYALSGSNIFMFHPTPAAADSFTIWYVPTPTEASSASHDFATSTYGTIPTALFPAIENYVLWKMADLDDDQSSGHGDKYRAEYEDAIRRGRKHLRDLGGSIGPARLRARRSPVGNPSTSPAYYP